MQIKVWDLTTCQLKCDLTGHSGHINTISVSPDGSLCASGGKVCLRERKRLSLTLFVVQDGTAILWDLTEAKRLYELEPGDIIHSLCFSPDHYWLCAATQSSIKIWDLERCGAVASLSFLLMICACSKKVEFDLKPLAFDKIQQSKKGIPPYCVSLTWSADGKYLFGGYTDGIVRIWEVERSDGLVPLIDDP